MTITKALNKMIHNRPHAVAMICCNRIFTYDEINNYSNQIARMLINHGVTQNEIVGVLLPRSAEFVIVSIGILKANAVCFPIPYDLPEYRVHALFNDSQCQYLISDKYNKHRWKEVKNLFTYEEAKKYEMADINLSPDIELAYIIYTSGSSGQSKGVLLNHRGILNQIGAKINLLQMNDEDILCFNLGVGFVASIWQIFSILIVGGILAVYPDNGDDLIGFIKGLKITLAEMTPSFLNSLISLKSQETLDDSSLRALILTGEKVSKTLVEKYCERNKITLVNAYGLTETSDDIMQDYIGHNYYSSCNEITIGSVIPNTNAYVINSNNELCKEGEEGELYVSGISVAEGYLNDPELTNKTFIHNFKDTHKAAVKTGDLVRCEQDKYYYIGRKDLLTKLNGIRVNMLEVENEIKKIYGVMEAIVAKNSLDIPGDHLIAYVVIEDGVSTKIILSELMKILPPYMIPKQIIKINSIPINENGKIDRNIINQWIESHNKQIDLENKDISKLKAIWSEILNQDDFYVDDNFFDVGGNSMLALILVNRIQKEISSNITLKDILESSTISKLTQKISEGLDNGYLENTKEKKRGK